jgi:hypothetical protein
VIEEVRMSKFTLLGLAAWLGGFLLLGFQGISSLMGTAGTWQSMNLLDVAEPEQLAWIEKLPFFFLRRSADYLTEMPLFLLLFCLGVVFLILGAFKKA